MGRIFFRRANLIDGRNAPKKNATVVVEDDRITAVATNGDAPKPSANDVVYDLAGRSLMPGMVQCHYHGAYADCEHIEDIDLRYPATMLALIAAKNAELLLRSGFTGAVGAGTLHNIDATLKRAIDEGIILGPRLLPCGREFITTGDSPDVHPSWWKLQMEGGIPICDGPDAFRKAVRSEIKDGAEIIKLNVTGGHGFAFPAEMMMVTPEEMKAAADTAHGRGKKSAGTSFPSGASWPRST
ncbi:MAG: amidohydrolase family protein [Candidatus Binatus sp.]